MYQVIARKYRPQSFADVVNQEHVKSTLENAIAQNRIAHGYIFSGQRGTGKTTVARIVARCVNCEQGPTANPCGVCAACLEASGGGGMNVIEIDAASNRGINEMRELNQSVRQRPASARFKVFIIDEAHQITSDAFNALLKTIEEPPEWVIFILCTTESHKIPATIASRCQHFSFRSVDFEDLTKRMAWICEQEGIEADADALAVIAAAGEGSVRDSLSALDQAIACCGSKLNAAEVRALLGAFSIESLEKVSGALAASDPQRMLEVVDELERNGHNLQHFSRELSRYFRNLMVARIAGADRRLLAASDAQREQYVRIAAQFSEEDLTRYLALSLELFSDLQTSLQPRFHLELGLVRLVHAGRLVSIEEALSGTAPVSAAAPVLPRPAAARSAPPSPPAPVLPAPPIAPRPPVAPPPPATPPARIGPSPFELDRNRKPGAPLPPMPPEPVGMTAGDPRQRLHQYLMANSMTHLADAVENATIEVVGGELAVTAPKSYNLYFRDKTFEQAVREVFGRPLRLKLTLGESGAPQPALSAAKPKGEQEDEATARALADAEVQRFREVLGGEVRRVRNLKE